MCDNVSEDRARYLKFNNVGILCGKSRHRKKKMKEDRKKINHVCFLCKHATQGLKYQRAARNVSFLPSTLLIPMSRKQRGRCTLIPMIT